MRKGAKQMFVGNLAPAFLGALVKGAFMCLNKLGDPELANGSRLKHGWRKEGPMGKIQLKGGAEGVQVMLYVFGSVFAYVHNMRFCS